MCAAMAEAIATMPLEQPQQQSPPFASLPPTPSDRDEDDEDQLSA